MKSIVKNGDIWTDFGVSSRINEHFNEEGLDEKIDNIFVDAEEKILELIKNRKSKESEDILDRCYYLSGALGHAIQSRLCKRLSCPSWFIKKYSSFPRFFDHAGVIKYIFSKEDGSKEELKFFVSEPYDLDNADINELLSFCKENNMSFKISGESFHFPGKTLRIILYKNK